MEFVADVRGQGSEAVIWQIRPDAAAHLQGAEKLKVGAFQTEMTQCAAELSRVELRVVGDDEIGASQAFQKLGRDGGEFGGVLDIEPRQPVAFGEVFAEPAESLRRSHEPVEGFREDAVMEDREAGGADAGVGVVSGFEVDAGDVHGFRCGGLRSREDAAVSGVGQRKGMSPKGVLKPRFPSRLCSGVC